MACAVGLSRRQCLCSIFQYHNETGKSSRPRETLEKRDWLIAPLSFVQQWLMLDTSQDSLSTQVAPIRRRSCSLHQYKPITKLPVCKTPQTQACSVGNIYTHLIPAIIIISALLFQGLKVWPLAQLAFLECVLPMIICLSGSVLYHTFMANHWRYRQYLLIDVSPSPFTRLVILVCSRPAQYLSAFSEVLFWRVGPLSLAR